MKYKVVTVAIRKVVKHVYCVAEEITVGFGDIVIVQVGQGVEAGRVVSGILLMSEGELGQQPETLVRKAAPDDLATIESNKIKELEYFRLTKEKIKEHNLPMRLIDVELIFDQTKVIFYFTADGRVDFRELVKDLARNLRMRIELRQIGVRDKAKLVGGIGSCGRVLCCRSFLKDFEPVTIKMAKEQTLSLNPIKISGVCGRLMCCLKYEYEIYHEIRKELPPIGSEVIFEDNVGKVVALNIPKKTVIIELPSAVLVEAPPSEVKVKRKPDPEVEKEGEIAAGD